MESQTACRPEQPAQTAPNSGLESLAAEASRRAESMETQAEPGPSGEGEGTARTSQASGQKGKVRKAYTITKQRERWTDGEHERFLQALKRYGRAWRKIEEHIGTKTAVQIRSHAQKFFSKLQKEQSSNRGVGEESSKAGISIPPPRPKRKPMHPYPRKLSENGTDNTTSCQQPGSATQPCAAPSQAQLLSYPMLDTRGGEPSLGQVLEAAAMAAANAWSQVVASAGSKVQQQLQAHVAAQQGAQVMSPFMSMGSMNSMTSGLAGMNPALLYQMAAQQAPQQMVANLQSSSHHPMGKSAFPNSGNPDGSLTGTSTPHVQGQTQSMQDSPDGGGTTVADHGNERDSACSKEYSLGKSGPRLDQAAPTLAGRQSAYEGWQSPDNAPQPENRLVRVAWELMAQANAATAATANTSVGGSQWAADPAHLATLNRNPSRAFSAGPVLHGRQAAQQAEQDPGQSSPGAVEAEGTEHKVKPLAAQSKSDTSQLANFYQQAATEEQQAADEQQAAENGSTADGDGSSGDYSNAGKLGLLRSDKGSNAGTSGSDEDGHGNGSRSGSDNGAIDPTDAADVNITDGKGSDEGSNSPRAPFTRNSTPSGEPSNIQTAAVGGLNRTPQQGMFSLGNGIDHARMAAATSQLQHQQPSTLTQPLAQQQPHAQAAAVVVPQAVLSQPALAAYQQQALSAWAAGAQQPHPMSYQLIQSLLSNLQNNSRDKMPACASVAPPAGEGSLMDRKSSGVASMDIFRASSSRSYSLPPGIATGTEGAGSRDGLQAMGEEASGFKPYNKRHGMPVTSLPPTKRFAAATSTGNKPVAAPAVAPNVITTAAAHCPSTAGMPPGLPSPFGLVAERDPSRKP